MWMKMLTEQFLQSPSLSNDLCVILSVGYKKAIYVDIRWKLLTNGGI